MGFAVSVSVVVAVEVDVGISFGAQDYLGAGVDDVLCFGVVVLGEIKADGTYGVPMMRSNKQKWSRSRLREVSGSGSWSESGSWALAWSLSRSRLCMWSRSGSRSWFRSGGRSLDGSRSRRGSEAGAL